MTEWTRREIFDSLLESEETIPSGRQLLAGASLAGVGLVGGHTAGTGYNPDASGPKDEPGVAWDASVHRDGSVGAGSRSRSVSVRRSLPEMTVGMSFASIRRRCCPTVPAEQSRRAAMSA